MPEKTSPPANNVENLTESPDWRVRLKEMGRRAFELAEMERLGFWPPSAEVAARSAAAQAELKEIQNQLRPLQKQVRALEKEIAAAGDIEKILAEIRAARIERVKRERAARKIRQVQEREEKIARDKAWREKTLPHLGVEVSKGLNFNNGNGGKLQKIGLPLLHSAEELAGALKISTSKLAWLTFHRSAATIDHYHHFQIPKKSGGARDISAPKKDLKAAQNWINENLLSRALVHDAAAAFLPQKNIADNAARHAAPGVLLRIDLQDFFPSITFRRVKKIFGSLGYNEGVSSLLALLCTEAPRVAMTLDERKYFVALNERFLPQGASTSPALTNILCRDLDARLAGAARKLGWEYSRYADDLVFSSKQKNADARAMLDFASQIISDEKFRINENKTAIMRAHQRQSVTGLVVNAPIENVFDMNRVSGSTPTVAPARVSRRDLKCFRAFLHHYETRGREAMTEQLGQDALSYARGYWAFIHMIDPQRAAKIRAEHSWLERNQNSE
jgi:retron-type reverse transcriptase